MRFLILSASTGGGHNSAAKAVAETEEACGNEACLCDTLKLRNETVSQRVSSLYAGVTLHAPRLFGGLYRAGQAVSSPGGRSPVYRMNTRCAAELLAVINFRRPDAIICTHIFSAQTVTFLRERYGLKTPAVGIATDYTCIPFWEESALDGYIIPAPELAGEFAARGLPAQKLAPLGIPVRRNFLSHSAKGDTRREFGLTAAHIFLVMGGSMGYGDIAGLAQALVSAVPDSQTVVLCGSREQLFREVSSIPHVVPMRYTDRVAALMDAADVLLTKPGGLSVTEAMAKRVPMVLTRPIPGCEERNAEFLSARGTAFAAGNTERAVRLAARLAQDPDAAREMVLAQECLYPGNANERIADYLTALGGTAKGV